MSEFPSEFDKLDAASVFKKVGKQLSSDKSRSLWIKIHSELQSGGIPHVKSHLESNLKQKAENVREALKSFKEEEKE
ncbi:MAG: hypothetical protein ACUVXA_13045 [Candidatus Jordarchaeum sp.]|uniref:hypothetical protein n=1 Tax=Candidatus Jordarchaeum sp. TaxID=2823881 RepID=UPI0040490FDE